MLGASFGLVGPGRGPRSPESLATVAAALEARWKAEGRDDVAVVSLLPRGRPWYSPAPESRLRLIGLLLGSDPHDRVPECIDAARHDRPGAAEGARHSRVAWRGPRAAAASAAGRAPDARGARRRGRRTPRVLDGARAGAAHGQPVHTGDLDVSPDLKVVLFTFGVALAVAAAIGVMPALRWSRVNTLPALQGDDGRPDAPLAIATASGG